MKVEKTTYGSFGSCICITNGKVELFATLELGPRIIRFAPVGGDNIMFEDEKREISVNIAEYKWFDSDTWYIYGGHRLWISPEGMPKSYYSDNHPVAYEIIPGGVLLKQRTQEYLHIALQMKVVMEDSGKVTVTHSITNQSGFEVELAPWALTVLAKGGREAVPQTSRETGLLGNRILALWPYSDMSDKRVSWGKKFTVLAQDAGSKTAFKFGSTNEDGYAAYFVNSCMFLKQYTHVVGGNYPDFGVSFETYTNNHMLEMETLGQLVTLAHGDATEHTEIWQLIDGVADPCDDEGAIIDTVAKYL